MEDLPPELVEDVLLRLPPDQLIPVCMSSRRLHGICTSLNYWRERFRREELPPPPPYTNLSVKEWVNLLWRERFLVEGLPDVYEPASLSEWPRIYERSKKAAQKTEILYPALLHDLEYRNFAATLYARNLAKVDNPVAIEVDGIRNGEEMIRLARKKIELDDLIYRLVKLSSGLEETSEDSPEQDRLYHHIKVVEERITDVGVYLDRIEVKYIPYRGISFFAVYKKYGYPYYFREEEHLITPEDLWLLLFKLLFFRVPMKGFLPPTTKFGW